MNPLQKLLSRQTILIREARIKDNEKRGLAISNHDNFEKYITQEAKFSVAIIISVTVLAIYVLIKAAMNFIAK